jgi:putative hydrolase
MPFFGEIMRALSSQGPLNLDAARQFALLGATGGSSEPNIDPLVRVRYEELSRIAVLHVADVCAVEQPDIDLRLTTRAEWAATTLEDYRPLFTELATSLTSEDQAGESDDPLAQMMSGLSRMMAPAMLGMTIGSMVGALAQRVFGVHDLPIPRPRGDLMLIPTTIDSFAGESGIDLDEMRLWVLSHEIAGRLLFDVEALRAPLSELIRRHAAGFRPDPGAVADKLSGLDLASGDPMESVQEAFSDPTLLLGAVQSEEQRQLQPALDAAVAMVIGCIDWVVDAVAVRIIGGDALQIAESIRSRRIDPSPDDVFVERLLGIRVGQDQVALGKAFIQGVIDRVGDGGISLILGPMTSLPTPAEIGAPGLWLARVSEA